MIRDLTALDVKRLEQMHRERGFQYNLPDPMGSEILVRQGYEYNGVIEQAILARRTVELYMIGNPSFETPAIRLEVLKKLHNSVEARLAQLGVQDAFVWVPPQVQSTFCSRLAKTFGWVPAPWVCMTTFVRPVGG